jgi:uncharacterized membrane protein YoaK (UPF0700 family)
MNQSLDHCMQKSLPLVVFSSPIFVFLVGCFLDRLYQHLFHADQFQVLSRMSCQLFLSSNEE